MRRRPRSRRSTPSYLLWLYCYLTTVLPYYLTLPPYCVVPSYLPTLLPYYYILPPTNDQELDAFRASLDVRAFFLAAPRMPLCERIDARCCQMLEGGLLEEVVSSE